MKFKLHWPFKNSSKSMDDSCINTYYNKKPLQWLACILVRFLAGVVCIILLPISLLNLLLELVIDGLVLLYERIPPTDAEEALASLKLFKMKYEDGPSCDECDKFISCKCRYCGYLGQCFSCPSSDCEDAFEDQLYEEYVVAKEQEAAESQLNKALKEDGKCDICENSEECKCIECPNNSECTSCPSETCVEDFESMNND